MFDLYLPRKGACATALLGAVVWLAAAPGATWHVDNARGADSNDGKTPDSAFATIAKALSACKTSDTLVLANTGQAYRERIALGGLGGTAAKPFTIEGNGAVISGFKPLPLEKWERKDNDVWFFAHRRPSQNPHLRFDGRYVAAQRKPDGLKPGQYCWAETGVFFRSEAGKTPKDYNLEGTFYSSGVQISNASYIVCRNLVAEGFPNDGFNIHGDCQGIVFENIEGRCNGDDGFSIHEDVSAVVRNGWFHHNNYGIQDVNASRSVFFGVLAENNRISGVEFHGGAHLLVDAVVRDNAKAQVVVNHSPAPHIGLSNASLGVLGLTLLKNVSLSGGAVALEVTGKGSVMATNCVFRGATTGVAVAADATCHLTACVISDCEETEVVSASARMEADLNLYHPGRFVWQGQRFAPEQWEAFRAATGLDKLSRLGQPSFAEDGTLRPDPTAPAPKAPQLRPGLTRPAFAREPGGTKP